MNCLACKKFHLGYCNDKSVRLSKRMKAGAVWDGDRSSAAEWFRTDAKAKDFAEEVEELERQLDVLRKMNRVNV